MQSAHYGRMRTGRCLITNYQVGCSADVIAYVDGRCSGQRRCTVTVPDPELFGVQPCRKDLVAYFEASYKCVEGNYDDVNNDNNDDNNYTDDDDNNNNNDDDGDNGTNDRSDNNDNNNNNDNNDNDDNTFIMPISSGTRRNKPDSLSMKSRPGRAKVVIRAREHPNGIRVEM